MIGRTRPPKPTPETQRQESTHAGTRSRHTRTPPDGQTDKEARQQKKQAGAPTHATYAAVLHCGNKTQPAGRASAQHKCALRAARVERARRSPTCCTAAARDTSRGPFASSLSRAHSGRTRCGRPSSDTRASDSKGMRTRARRLRAHAALRRRRRDSVDLCTECNERSVKQ